jgi:hypothetical protein
MPTSLEIVIAAGSHSSPSSVEPKGLGEPFLGIVTPRPVLSLRRL